MDPEPKGLRSIVLLSTVVVILSSVIGYLVWWTAYGRGPPIPSRGPGGGLSTVSIRPMDFLPGTTAEERERITSLLKEVLAKRGDTPDRDIVLALAALGEAAAPRALDALHGLFSTDAFKGEETRRQAGFLDRILRRISQAKVYPMLAPTPIRAEAEPEDVVRAVKAWFQWWDAVRPPSGGR